MNKFNLNDWKKAPNLVSIFRIIFIPIVLYLFKNLDENKWLIIFSVIIFSILDNLDGYLARSKNQITEFGKIVDPLVDKLFVITIALNLYLLKLLPLWFMLVVVLRDILIMLAGLILMKKVDQVPQSDFIGKLTVGAIGIVFLLSILDYQKLKDVFNLSLILCTLLIFISLINYGNKQFFRKK